MPLFAQKEPVSSKHGEEVATGSTVAESSTVQGSACPTVQALYIFYNMLNTTHAIRTKFSRNESHSVGFNARQSHVFFLLVNNQPHITHYSYMKVLKMGVAPSRLCLMKTSMYISYVFCFALSVSQVVLRGCLRVGFLLSNSSHNHWPCDKNKHKFS